MSKPKTKSITCKNCGFIFTVEVMPEHDWVDSFGGCFTPDLCEQQALREWAEETLNAASNHTMGYSSRC